MSDKVEIEVDIWCRNHQVLFDARENSIELLNEHINKFGTDYAGSITEKNRVIADAYEKEIREINSLLEYSSAIILYHFGVSHEPANNR